MQHGFVCCVQIVNHGAVARECRWVMLQHDLKDGRKDVVISILLRPFGCAGSIKRVVIPCFVSIELVTHSPQREDEQNFGPWKYNMLLATLHQREDERDRCTCFPTQISCSIEEKTVAKYVDRTK